MYIDFNKYKRVFAFGCSFTNYVYPTWADLIMHEMPSAECYNFGRSGAGNHFIACAIAEAHTRFNFDENDLVLVMYSTAFREDRYIDESWKTFGNIYNQQYYDKHFVKNYVDPVGCVVRDMALMEMSKRYLDMLPCDTLALRASPVEQEMADLLDDKMSNVLDLYKNMYYSFPPTLQETMFPDGWLPTMERGTPDNLHVDQHPLPIDYYNYLVKLGINVTDKEYAEESTRKAYLTNPDCSDWEVYFPDTAEIANKSMRIMF
jgi:hypothetical protein